MKTTASEFSELAIFEYPTIGLNSISIDRQTDPNTNKSWIETIRIGDEVFPASTRFMTSLYARFGFGEKFFQYFTPDEVIARVMEKHQNDRIRVCIARFKSGETRLLGASNPMNGIAHADAVLRLFGAFGSENLTYNDGMFVSTQSPRVAPTFPIAGDDYTNKFTMSVPIDGYGGPFVMLALHRLVTQSNLVAQCKVFRSDLKLGKGGDDLESSLGRALDSFNNDEGYAAVRERLESAATSWASVNEAESFRMLLHKHVSYGHAKYNADAPGISTGHSVIGANLSMSEHLVDSPDMADRGNMLLKAYHRLTGNIQEQLGFANLDTLTEKRRRSIPVKCRVLDLVNMASEVASHHLLSGHGDFNQWIGAILSNEYDIEGSMATFPNFDAFWTDRKFGRGVSAEAAAN